MRLGTFSDWPATAKVAATDLARAGFFYTGGTDRVQCAFCHGYLRNWVDGDTPDGEHRRHFPHCPFVCGTTVNNVPIGAASQVVISIIHCSCR